MDTYIATAERAAAAALRAAAATLSGLSARLESGALSTVCAAALPTGLPAPSALSPLQQIGFYLFCSLLFVAAATLGMSAYLCGTPYLDAVPAPSAVYDADADPQSESFPDADVRPQLVPRGTPGALQATNPATGATLGFVPVDDAASVGAAVARAAAAQKEWAGSSYARRRRVLRTLSAYIVYEQRALCELAARDTGKTMADAALGEIVPTLEKLRWLVAEGEAALAPERRSVGPLTVHKRAVVHFQPLGVLAAIAPWNYPLHNLLNPVAAGLFAGCAVVVKPSEHATWSSLHFVRVVRRALALCGEPVDLVALVVGGPDVGEALVAAPGVDKVFFTGSTAVGRRVALAAAKRLVPTCLELGGKDALVVCPDADVPHAVSICLRGVFQNAGQNCVAVERVFLHDDVAEQFVRLALDRVRAMRLGVDVGAMTMGQPAIDHVQRLVDDAVAAGAKVLAGGKAGTVDGHGFYFEPTVLTDVTSDMRIANEEVFGPVLTVLKWHDEDEMIDQVNGCKLRLGSNVFCGDKRRGERILLRIRAGMGNVNDFATNYLCQSMPFGGTADSGSDRFAGVEGLRGCCIPRATTVDRWPGIRTLLPKALQYPVSANAFEFAAELNDLVYSTGILCKLDSIRSIVGMLLMPSWRPRTTASG